jgi:hypothetical protein
VRKLVAIVFLLLLSLPSDAVDGQGVRYVGGTAPKLQSGTIGSLDTTSEASLIFKSAGNKVDIPYSSIQSFQYQEEVARHLGLLPAIVVALFKVRQHRHFFVISYHDESGSDGHSVDQVKATQKATQVVIFEVPKDMPRTLRSVLEARAPQRSEPCNSWGWRDDLRAKGNPTFCDTHKTVPDAHPPESN